MCGVCAQEPGIDVQVQTVPEIMSSWAAKHFPRENHALPVQFSLHHRGEEAIAATQCSTLRLVAIAPPITSLYIYNYTIIIAVTLR